MGQTLSKMPSAWLDRLPFPIFIGGLAEDRLLYCNRRAVELFQGDAKPLPGKVSKLFENPADFSELLALLRDTGGVIDFEACMKSVSGQRFWTQIAASEAEIDHRPVVLFSVNGLSACENTSAQFLCNHALWKGVFEHAGVGIVILDRESRLVAVNDCWQEMFGYTQQEVCDRHFPALARKEDRARWENGWQALACGESDGLRMEMRFLRKDGGLFWCDVSVTPLRNRTGELESILCFLLDIGDRKLAEQRLQDVNLQLVAQLAEIQALQEKLSEEALRDSLTGLYNRRYLEETLARELLRAGREERPLSLVMMDIDHFKRLNDTYGHQAGDLVLKELGAMLREHIRGEDIACRFGGEEFVAILPGASLETAVERAEAWRRAFQAMRLPFEGQCLQSTLSLGIASFPKQGATGDELLFQADSALYMAKRAGRNRVKVCG